MINDSSAIGFGVMLRQLRKSSQLSQLELAGRAGISGRHLSFLETGRSRPSAAMVSRLAEAVGADGENSDRLRFAAGFSSRHRGRHAPGAGDQLLESALLIEDATSAAAVVAAARPALAAFGATKFFFGVLSRNGRANPVFDWSNFGSFPQELLLSYDREGNAATDPLLRAVDRDGGCFFWDEVIDRPMLRGQPRRMFERAADNGMSTGFVASQRRGESAQIVSMMGRAIDAGNPQSRIALEIIGTRMLGRLGCIGAMRPSDTTKRALPLR